jgi:CsoR family transcriptional regulator, copper-sensing transcriptional repressor
MHIEDLSPTARTAARTAARSAPGAPSDPGAGAVSTPAATSAPGYSEDKTAVLKRLRRVEGQVRGLQRMVEEDRYCIEVLEQIAAANRALQAVALQLLEDHMAHCVADAVRAGGDVGAEKLAEASAAVGRLVRS